MALSAENVPIQRPCPVELDPGLSDGSRRSWHCGHCDKRVHVLSSMTEPEAREFLRAREGQDLCVTYMEKSDGSIYFRSPPPPPVVPVSALAPRRLALGLGAVLAACTPVERPEPKTAAPTAVVSRRAEEPPRPADDTSLADLVRETKVQAREQDKLARVEAEPPPPPAEPPAEPPVKPMIPRPGGIRVPHIAPPPVAPPSTGTVATAEEEPCDPPPATVLPSTIKRGGMRARPIR